MSRKASIFAALHRNVWILALSQALALSAVPMMLLAGSLLGSQIAPDERFATLPIAIIVVGTACAAIPAALTMKRLGRKRGGFVGFGIGLSACGFGYIAAMQASFPILLLASFLVGVSSSFGQQFRFAALESVDDPANYGPALSVFMTGGLLAAFLGPELGARGRDLVSSPHGFAGSFALMAAALLLAVFVFTFYRERALPSTVIGESARPIGRIMRSRAFLCAASAAALSYAVMSFIMTATPITMHDVCGFGLDETKRVIQGHIVAMFLPSLASGWLMKRFGEGKLMAVGLAFYLAVVVIGLWGQELVHFWGALLLLGVGWNFLFASGTALLPRAYAPAERFKAQAANDVMVFATQAAASLSAGWFVYSFGWSAVMRTCVPMLLLGIWLLVVLFRRRV